MQAPETRIARSARWVTPLLLVLIVIGFYWKLTLSRQYTWLAHPDFSAMVLPWMQFQAVQWHAGHFPLWDPTAWCGQPLLGQAQPGAAYPLNWLLFLAPLKHGVIRIIAVHWYYVVIRILAALAMYLFCRDVGSSYGASILGGLVYGVGGYVGSVEFPQMVNGAVWAPLVFLFQFRAVRGGQPIRNAILSGFFGGLMWLCGHHQLPMFVSIAYALLWIYLILQRRIWPRIQILRSAAIALMLMILVGGFQTVPMAEYGRLAVRWVGADHPMGWRETVPYSSHIPNTLRPLGLASIVVPGLDMAVSPLMGALAFALAVTGVWRAWRDERVRWLAALAAGAVIFSLGPASVFHGFFYAVVPLVEKARVPAHAMILFNLAAAALAAYGLDMVPKLPRSGSLALTWSILGCGVLLTAAGVGLVLSKVLVPGSDARFMVTALACGIGAPVLWSWWKGALGRGSAITALVCLILLELGTTSGYSFAHADQKDRMDALRRMDEDQDIREYLARQPDPYRIEYNEDDIPHNIGDWWGVETFSTYVASAPEIVWRNEPFNPRVQAMMGVRYYLGIKPLRQDLREVFAGASGRKVYRYPESFPRAWAVHETMQVSERDTWRSLVDPSFDLSSRALTTEAVPMLEKCGGDSVTVGRHTAGHVELNVNMRCRGMVVLSDTYFPGWSARIDGQPAKIYAADGFLRGVAVDAGQHTIAMRYRPASVFWGAAMTILGSMLALAAGWMRKE